MPVLCIGETEAENEAGKTEEVCARQIDAVINTLGVEAFNGCLLYTSYSGLDRISSANQVTVGGTTRFYDKNADERFNFSAGQIYYLTASKIDDNPNNRTPKSSSSWALESNWKISDKWNWRGSYQYDTCLLYTSPEISIKLE